MNNKLIFVVYHKIFAAAIILNNEQTTFIQQRKSSPLNMPIRVLYEKSATPFPDVVIVLILRVF